MKVVFYLIILTQLGFAQGDSASVRFVNGDKLSGNVVDLSVDTLTWQSALLKQPAAFDLNQVVDLTIPSEFDPESNDLAAHQAVLEMTNGDILKGQLTALNDDEIRLNTWYAGEITIRRVNVKAVNISRNSKVFYRGPSGIDDWTHSSKTEAWTYQSGQLISNREGGIAREIDLPAEAKIAFEASWRGAFRPKILFYSSDITTSNPKSGYELIFQGNSVHLKRADDNEWIGHTTNAGVLRENEKAKIEIRVSTKTGKVLLYINDKFIEMWQDDKLDKNFGKGIHFISQNTDTIRISNIVVSEWDGYVEDLSVQQNPFRDQGFRGLRLNDFEDAEEPAAESIPDGRMLLSNGDTVEGEVLEIKDEMIRMKTPFTEVSFPIYRLKNIALNKDNMETPKLYKGDVKATLADGSKLVFRLDNVKDGHLMGYSQNFGQAKFVENAFERIEFNIHERKMEEIRERANLP